jgi:RNA polymerase sigma factor (sigma-70 family)
MSQVMVGDPDDEPGGDEDTRSLVAAQTDPEAFAAFYRRNSSRVIGFYYRRTLCSHTSAELAAETFAQALGSVRRFDPAAGSGRAWLFGIAGNLYRQWLRKGVVRDRARRRLGITTPALTEDDLEHIESLVDLTTLQTALRRALEDLTPAIRDAVLMRVAHDLPYEEVAESLDCTVGAARVRVARGLQSLALTLEPRL